MRIALFSWETLHSIPIGGVAVHVTELAAALQRRGNEVHVFTRPAPHQGLFLPALILLHDIQVLISRPAHHLLYLRVLFFNSLLLQLQSH